MKDVMIAAAWLLLVLAPAVAPAEEAHLMRWADVHGDRIVFTYEDDLWVVPSAGGEARRLTSHPGAERYAKFSPDGELIAFTGSYDGGTDVYVMDSRGGVPRRLTFHPAADRVLGWHPDGTRVLFRSRREFTVRAEAVYLVSINGGLERRLAVDRAGLADLSPDGRSIAYNRNSREDATWKRYQGGEAQEIWLGRLDEGDFQPITSWEGTDNYPMWQGSAIYFSSDREHGTLNLYRLDLGSREVTALTSYRDYDVKYPSIGPGAIVFQHQESLHLLDLASGQVRKVAVSLASDRASVWPERVAVEAGPGSFSLTPDGERLLLEARGELLSIPAGEGEAVNLTRSSQSREKNGAWSPDGTQMALISDRGGDEALWLLDGKGAWRRLTSGSPFMTQPVWSPDGRFIVYSDKEMKLNLVEVATGTVSVIDRGEVDDAWERWGIQDYAWSPDSRWIAYTKMEPSLYESIFVYSMSQRRSSRLTDGWTNDWSPSFSPDGRFLYFLSNRTFNPVMGFVDQSHVFLDMTLPYLAILRAGEPSPFAPGADGAEDEKAGEKGAEEGAGVAVAIDLDGIAGRIVPAEGVEPGNYFRLEATDDGFLYLAKTANEFLKYQAVDDRTAGELELRHYDLGEESPKKLIDGIANYHLSADRSKTVYRAGSKIGIVDTGAEAEAGDGAVVLDDVRIKVTKLEEFQQIFDEAWRIERDWFYDPGLHGVDWQAIGDKYRRFVPSCGNRSDLNYLIGEMIGELNIGHTYVYGGDTDDGVERVDVGLLGADFELPEGAQRYQIAHIVPGRSWLPAERSPLAVPGCGVKAGDWLIAIDGREVKAGDNPFAFLEDTVGRAVEVTYNSRPTLDGASSCTVEPIDSEYRIREREWVERNRAKVDELSGGTIGYLYLPDMMEDGLIEFARDWFPQYRKRAIIIDERYNGGGFVADMIIDVLERRLWSLTKPREGIVLTDPERTFHGHLAVLINGDTGSNGEYFAEAVKRKGLATVIGRRTWGGAVGIEPHQDLVDGGTATPPQFGAYSVDGSEWLIEGHGVVPDIDVENLPSDVLAGRDPQLEAAVRHLQERLAEDPRELPPPPPYPDKSKPGEGRAGTALQLPRPTG
ncbi:MAG TPA: S41 family peptidase [Thermoanaerobaculales bacterium]|nr:S41 family peptidase [Thermoanaerobaculales bacterium]HQL30644.1 S41 family peptidase [Thermoanaerobaculales bacterium]HQN95216.1 S41 family peptidase [Thermoanaerobaculales bacterium]